MRISLRDLFWLTLIVGIVVAWGVERRRIKQAYANWSQGALYYPSSANRFGTREVDSQISDALRELSNEQLVAYLPNAKGHHSYTAYLLEMSRRRMSTELRNIYTSEKQAPSDDPNDPPNTSRRYWDNRELLTALRRAEGKPDPIKIELDSLGRGLDRKVASPSFIIPRITNVDAEREPFYVVDGYDSEECWQVRLTNSRGEVVPAIERNFEDFGGLSAVGMLRHGQSISNDNVLDVCAYLDCPPPGRYTLELLFSNAHIAGDVSFDGKFVWKSAPIPVIVERLTLPSNGDAIHLPLFILCAVLVLGMVALIQRWLMRPAPNGSLLQRRDVISLTLILLLSAVWCCDSLLLLESHQSRAFDSRSRWTIRLAK